MNKVKNIKFHLTWKGNGCVNYNGSNVTKALKKSGVDVPYHEVNGKNEPCKNVMFGKANYTIDESGNVVRIPKISATCIRNAILKEAEKSGIQMAYVPEVMALFLSSPAGYLHGHMLPVGNGYGRDSVLMVTDLNAINGVYNMENFTSHSFDEDGNRSNTSFYAKETLGETKYESTIVFNVARAQFLCLDDRFGKKSIPSDVYESGILERAFVKRIGRKPYTEGIFTDSSDCFGKYYGMYGYLFDDEYINYLLNKFIEMLWKTEINKATGNLYLEKIEMYVETDPLASEKEYVTLDKKDCGSYKFEYEQFWKPGTREEKFEK